MFKDVAANAYGVKKYWTWHCSLCVKSGLNQWMKKLLLMNKTVKNSKFCSLIRR